MTRATTSRPNVGTAGVRHGLQLFLSGAIILLGVPLMAGTSSADDFSNPAPITVPLSDPAQCGFQNCPHDRANPYPSEIAVSGLTGTVTDINVTLRDLTWQENGPADADIMVVAPDGKAVMIMSDACGDQVSDNPITTPITLTFDDQADAPLTADAACFTGTYQPFDDDDDTEFSPPGGARQADVFPAGTTPASTPPTPPATTVPLSTFNGIDPNGTWQLYVMDDYPNTYQAGANSGSIAGGWTLSVATTTTAATTSTTAAATTTTTSTQPATTTTTAPAVQAVQRTPSGTLPKTGAGDNSTRSVGVAGLLMASGLLLVVLAQCRTAQAGGRAARRNAGPRRRRRRS